MLGLFHVILVKVNGVVLHMMFCASMIGTDVHQPGMAVPPSLYLYRDTFSKEKLFFIGVHTETSIDKVEYQRF